MVPNNCSRPVIAEATGGSTSPTRRTSMAGLGNIREAVGLLDFVLRVGLTEQEYGDLTELGVTDILDLEMITEDDLKAVDWRLIQRRKLQKAFAKWQGRQTPFILM